MSITPPPSVIDSEGGPTFHKRSLEVTKDDLPNPETKDVAVKDVPQLRRQNEQSGISILPIEVLSTILQLACPPPHFFQIDYLGDSDPPAPLIKSAVTLSAVSHHWRQVAISTPQLWRVLRFNRAHNEQCRTESWVSMLRLCIERASSSMDILLDFEWGSASVRKEGSRKLRPHPQASDIFLDELEWVIFVESPLSIGTLSLKALTKTRWAQMVSLLGPLTKLKALQVDCMNVYHLDVKIETSEYRDVLGPRLTMLDLRHFPYDLAIDLLFHCPNLIRCSAMGPTYPRGNGVQREDDAHKLSNLRQLDWVASKYRDGLRFATASAPGLRKLQWIHATQSPNDAIVPSIDTAFVRFLSTAVTLTELDLSLRRVWIASPARHLELLPRIFNAVPTVKKLTLHVSRHHLSLIPSPLIGPLMAHSSRVPLPALQTLILKKDPGPKERGVRRDDQAAASLVMFLRERWELGLVRDFHLSFNFSWKDWNDEAYEGFRELVREGLRLEILVNSEPVGWLHT